MEEKLQEKLDYRDLISWQTRTICEWLSYTVPVPVNEQTGEPEGNPLAEAAHLIGLTPSQVREYKSYDAIKAEEESVLYLDENGDTEVNQDLVEERAARKNDLGRMSWFIKGLEEGQHRL